MKKNICVLCFICFLLTLVSCGKCSHPYTYTRNTSEIFATCTEYASWIEEVICGECGEILQTSQCYGNEKKAHHLEQGCCQNCDYVDNYYGYILLADYERLVFDSLMINIHNIFSDPSKIRLQAATGFDSTRTWIYLKINDAWYQLYVGDFDGKFGISFDKGYIFKTSSTYLPESEISVESINRALDFYFNY